MFGSLRNQLVQKFASSLFPPDGQNHTPFIFICSPPRTGKAALLILLQDHLKACFPGVPVIAMPACSDDDGFPAHFTWYTGHEYHEFLKRTDDRVLLIIGGLLDMEDQEDLWTGMFKEVIAGQRTGLRVVFAAPYCRFEGSVFSVEVRIVCMHKM